MPGQRRSGGARQGGGARRARPQQFGGAGDGGAQTTPEAERAKLTEVVAMVDSRREQLEMLLSGTVPLERFITVALHAVQTQRGILQCSALSIFSAIRDSAMYGLEPVGILGDAALVPYDGVCTLQPEYRGLRKLAMRSGDVAKVDASVVFTKDRFRILEGDEPRIEHELSLEAERGSVLGAYAFARFTNGELVAIWMPHADLLKRRNESKSWKRAEREGTNDSVWHKWFEEMCKKTVLKRLCTEKLPLTRELRGAIDQDNQLDAIGPTGVGGRQAALPGGSSRQQLLDRMGLDHGDASRAAAAKPVEASEPITASEGVSGGSVEISGADGDPGPVDSGPSGGAHAGGSQAPRGEGVPAGGAADPQVGGNQANPPTCGSPNPKESDTCILLELHRGDCRAAHSGETWKKPNGWDDHVRARGLV